LAGCGLWDLNDLKLGGFVHPTAVEFNNIILPAHAMMTGESNGIDDQVVDESQGGVSLPVWADIIKEPNKPIEVYAILEIMLIQQKTYSYHKDIENAELFVEVIWTDIGQRISATTLPSPLQTSTSIGYGFITKQNLIEYFNYITYSKNNTMASERRKRLMKAISHFKNEFIKSLPVSMQGVYNDDGSLMSWHIPRKPIVSSSSSRNSISPSSRAPSGSLSRVFLLEEGEDDDEEEEEEEVQL
jgi:hypothetical protein